MPSTLFVTGAAVLTLFSHSLVSPASTTEFPDPPTPPPTSQVTIDVVAMGGTGCQPGTTAVSVSPDNTKFALTYSQYVARVGVGAGPTDFRKSCQISMSLGFPEGYTFAISRTEFHGSASLAAGATGMRRASYYFSGQAPSPPSTHTFTGPLEDDWQTEDDIDVDAMVFHPCGARRNLNISTDLRVLAGTSDPTTTTSSLAMNSSVSTVYDFYWKRCP